MAQSIGGAGGADDVDDRFHGFAPPPAANGGRDGRGKKKGAHGGRLSVGVYGVAFAQPPMRDRALWVSWFAWASIEVPAWTRTWFLVNSVDSVAMSVSRM